MTAIRLRLIMSFFISVVLSQFEFFYYTERFVIKKQPVFLNMFQMRFPITAIVSILHRISGLGLFILLPGLLFLWQESLSSPASFKAIQVLCATFWVKLIIWLFCVGLLYHLLAGIRHLVMDCGFAESRVHSQRTARGVLVVSVLLGILLAWNLFH